MFACFICACCTSRKIWDAHLFTGNEYSKILHEMEDENMDKDSINALDNIHTSLENKANNIARYIQNIKSELNSIDDEINRLSKVKKSKERLIKSLSSYLESNMKQCNIYQIKSDIFKIKINKNPPKINILNADEIPNEYINIKQERTIDKLKIKDDIKQGVIVPGVELIQSEKLTIR